MATCEFCDTEMPADAPACPQCGRSRATRAQNRHHWIRIVVFVVLLVAVMAGWSWFTGFGARPD